MVRSNLFALSVLRAPPYGRSNTCVGPRRILSLCDRRREIGREVYRTAADYDRLWLRRRQVSANVCTPYRPRRPELTIWPLALFRKQTSQSTEHWQYERREKSAPLHDATFLAQRRLLQRHRSEVVSVTTQSSLLTIGERHDAFYNVLCTFARAVHKFSVAFSNVISPRPVAQFAYSFQHGYALFLHADSFRRHVNVLRLAGKYVRTQSQFVVLLRTKVDQ